MLRLRWLRVPLSLEQLPVKEFQLEENVAIFSAKSDEISFLNLSLYAQHQTVFTDRWMNSIFWFSKSRDGLYHVNEFVDSSRKIERLFCIPIKSDNHLPTIHFPLDEVYIIGIVLFLVLTAFPVFLKLTRNLRVSL